MGVFAEKYEATNIIEDPYAVDQYMRDTLKNVKPDAPIWASDQPRDNTSYSNYRLDMQYEGGKPDPYMPDLFLELTERDPRGTALEPNFRRVIEHAYERAQDLNLYPEAPENVPETEKTQEQLQVQKDAVFYEVKDRLKWFATSKDNMQSGKNFRGAADTALKEIVEGDATLSALMTDEANPNLQNPWVTNLSNTMPMGWQRTTDHEFNVASYGHIRSQKPMDTIEERKYHQEQDARKYTVMNTDGQILTTGMAALMRDTAAGQKARIAISDKPVPDMPLQQTIPKQYLYNVDPELQRQMQHEGMKTGRTGITFDQMARKLGAQKYDASAMLNTIGTTDMKSNMEQAVSAMRDRDPERKQRFSDSLMTSRIVAAMNNTEVDPVNRKAMSDFDPKSSRLNTMQVKARGLEEFKIAPLGSFKRPTGTEQMRSQRQTFAPVGGQSIQTPMGQRTKMGMQQSDAHHVADPTQNVREMGTYKGTTVLGSKFTRDKLDTDSRTNSINDV